MGDKIKRRAVELRGSYLIFFLSWLSFDFGKILCHERAWCYKEGVRNYARDGGGPPCSRFAGGGSKPPQAKLVKSQGCPWQSIISIKIFLDIKPYYLVYIVSGGGINLLASYPLTLSMTISFPTNDIRFACYQRIVTICHNLMK